MRSSESTRSCGDWCPANLQVGEEHPLLRGVVSAWFVAGLAAWGAPACATTADWRTRGVRK